MTEIPEHLLKRSRERRQAIGGDEGGEGASAAGSATASAPAVTTAAAAPARAAVAAPAPVAAPVPAPIVRPIPAYVAAANARKRVPIWALPVLAALPLWAYMYWKALTPPKPKVSGPLATGAVAYNTCASCHAADGSGGTGYKLSGGEVLKTFPKIEDQLNFVYLGTKAYAGKPYGDPARGRIGGAKGQMPSWGAAPRSINDAEILGAVCEERYVLGGADPAGASYKAEYDKWCAPDAPNWPLVEAGGFAAVKLDLTPKA